MIIPLSKIREQQSPGREPLIQGLTMVTHGAKANLRSPAPTLSCPYGKRPCWAQRDFDGN